MKKSGGAALRVFVVPIVQSALGNIESPENLAFPAKPSVDHLRKDKVELTVGAGEVEINLKKAAKAGVVDLMSLLSGGC